MCNWWWICIKKDHLPMYSSEHARRSTVHTQLLHYLHLESLDEMSVVSVVPVQICDVVCSGESNFQQHLSSKRHLRRTAQAGVQALDANTYNSAEEEKQQSSVEAANPTYMGLGAQCRTYCKQVTSVPSLVWMLKYLSCIHAHVMLVYSSCMNAQIIL